MKTVLVTGGSGFIGSHFCSLALELGWHPIVLSRNPSVAASKLPKDTQIIGHLDHLDAQQSIDILVNLAGEPIADRRWSQHRKAQIRLYRRLTIPRV